MEERDRHENSQSEGFFSKEILSDRGLISLIQQCITYNGIFIEHCCGRIPFQIYNYKTKRIIFYSFCTDICDSLKNREINKWIGNCKKLEKNFY